MNTSRCRVSFVDVEGIEHTANVQAASVYEAAALAIRDFKVDSFVTSKPTEPTTLLIEVLADPREHKLRVQQIVKWAAQSAGNPAALIKRQRIRAVMQEAL